MNVSKLAAHSSSKSQEYCIFSEYSFFIYSLVRGFDLLSDNDPNIF